MCFVLILMTFGVRLVVSGKFIENESTVEARSWDRDNRFKESSAIEKDPIQLFTKTDWSFPNHSSAESGIEDDSLGDDVKQSSTIIACDDLINCSRNSAEISKSLSLVADYFMSEESSQQADRRYDDDQKDASDSSEYFYVRHSNARPRNSFEKYRIDYKKAYGLRYDPNSIKRSSSYHDQQDTTEANSTSYKVEILTPSQISPMIVQDNIEDFDEAGASSETRPTSDLLDFSDSVETFNVSSSQAPTTKPNPIVQSDEPGNATNIMNPIRPNAVPDKLKEIFMYPSADQFKVLPGQRFLSIFDVIKFRNVPCVSLRRPLRPLNGTCYHRFECDSMGGVAVDMCAGGFGVCCVFQLGCGGVVRQNVSYFRSPGFPMPFRDKVGCTLTVELLRGTKQVLLEFIFFELKPPINGDCIDDQFLVSGQSSNFKVPTICGINTGQHMYIDVEDSIEGRLFLSIITNSLDNRAFNIRVTQFRENVTPKSCLQYHDSLTGMVQSFNYENQAKYQEMKPSYFNNLNYVICIRRLFGFCEVSYANVANGTEYQFDMRNVNREGESLVPPRQAGVEIFSCPQDFLAVNAIRLCGERLNDGSTSADFTINSPVTDKTGGPIIIPVRTDKAVVGKGFKLLYKLIPC